MRPALPSIYRHRVMMASFTSRRKPKMPRSCSGRMLSQMQEAAGWTLERTLRIQR